MKRVDAVLEAVHDNDGPRAVLSCGVFERLIQYAQRCLQSCRFRRGTSVLLHFSNADRPLVGTVPCGVCLLFLCPLVDTNPSLRKAKGKMFS
jgi:hypothetical protein